MTALRELLTQAPKLMHKITDLEQWHGNFSLYSGQINWAIEAAQAYRRWNRSLSHIATSKLPILNKSGSKAVNSSSSIAYTTLKVTVQRHFALHCKWKRLLCLGSETINVRLTLNLTWGYSHNVFSRTELKTDRLSLRFLFAAVW